jgi:hypothetical protein
MPKLPILLSGIALLLAAIAVMADGFRWVVVFAALLAAIALVISVTPGRAAPSDRRTHGNE